MGTWHCWEMVPCCVKTDCIWTLWREEFDKWINLSPLLPQCLDSWNPPVLRGGVLPLQLPAQPLASVAFGRGCRLRWESRTKNLNVGFPGAYRRSSGGPASGTADTSPESRVANEDRAPRAGNWLKRSVSRLPHPWSSFLQRWGLHRHRGPSLSGTPPFSPFLSSQLYLWLLLPLFLKVDGLGRFPPRGHSWVWCFLDPPEDRFQFSEYGSLDPEIGGHIWWKMDGI